MRAYAIGLHDLMLEMVPAPVAGADPTGAVRIRVGADGLPDRAEVDADWQRRLTAEGFARAVLQAAASAVAAQSDALRQLWAAHSQGARGWRERLDRPPAEASAADGRQPPGGWPALSSRPERELGEVLEDGLRVTRRAGPAGVGTLDGGQVAGRAAGDGLVVEVSAQGLSFCRADAAWVGRRGGEELGIALTEALIEARADLLGLGARTEADGLFAELLALIARPEGRAGAAGAAGGTEVG